MQERVSAAVILVFWPQFKTWCIYCRGKKCYIAASVHTWGIFNHYCLNSRI